MIYDEAQYYETRNYSVSLLQDFVLPISPKLDTSFGFKAERKDLQKAYLLSPAPAVVQNSTGQYTFPAALSDSPDRSGNNYLTTDLGVYGQARYNIVDPLNLHAGLRLDNNSIYGTVLNPRVGLVYDVTPQTVAKLFYGSAFLEPQPRSLYGTFNGKLENPNLVPEKVKTLEASVTQNYRDVVLGADVYYNLGTDVITTLSGGGVGNVGSRHMWGVDLTTRYQSKDVPGLDLAKVDAYLSYVNSQEDIDNTGNYTPTGDIAPYKLHLILTGYPTKKINFSFQNRWISSINLVSTDPLGSVSGYFVSDFSLNFLDVGWKGFDIGFKVYNIFDTTYFQPGYSVGDAGENPDGSGATLGSPGYYNSRLPQPGRTFFVSARLTI